jgi:hypothetical protein
MLTAINITFFSYLEPSISPSSCVYRHPYHLPMPIAANITFITWLQPSISPSRSYSRQYLLPVPTAVNITFLPCLDPAPLIYKIAKCILAFQSKKLNAEIILKNSIPYFTKKIIYSGGEFASTREFLTCVCNVYNCKELETVYTLDRSIKDTVWTRPIESQGNIFFYIHKEFGSPAWTYVLFIVLEPFRATQNCI